MKTHDLIVTANHLELTDSLKTYIAEKSEKLYQHDKGILRLRIELDLELNKGPEKRFAARGHAELRGRDLVASAVSENAHAAIEQMVHKLDRQLRHGRRLKLFKRVRPHAIDLAAELPKVPAGHFA